MDYIFYSDPGHGWLRVPIAEVEEFKLDITSYSFVDSEFVYLEEDFDMQNYLTAKFGNDVLARMNFMKSCPEVYHENVWIRNLKRWGEK